MDVVDARREEWERDPFKLIEENGNFYGRGTSDNKAGVVAMMSTILRILPEITARHAPLEQYVARCTARPAFQRALDAQIGDFEEAA